ncbi:DUF3363 domain-containing protein [Bradyrhizobium sp. URHC0002]
MRPTLRRSGRRCDAPGSRPSASRRGWSESAGHGDFRLRSTVIADVVGAGTSWRQSCSHADRRSDRVVSNWCAGGGNARPSSPDRSSRHRLGPPGPDRLQRERPSSGRFAMSEDGLGFSLVPWRDALEPQIRPHISGIVMPVGTVDWSFTAARVMPLSE